MSSNTSIRDAKVRAVDETKLVNVEIVRELVEIRVLVAFRHSDADSIKDAFTKVHSKASSRVELTMNLSLIVNTPLLIGRASNKVTELESDVGVNARSLRRGDAPFLVLTDMRDKKAIGIGKLAICEMSEVVVMQLLAIHQCGSQQR